MLGPPAAPFPHLPRSESHAFPTPMPLRSALAAALLLATPAVHAQANPVGDWSGTLVVPTAQLRVLLHVTQADSGLAATMDIPDQNAFDLAADATELRADTLQVRFDRFQIRLDLAVASDSLRGTFSQGPARLPLALGPDTSAPMSARPQTPAGPFPYAEVPVTVESEPGVTLAGTLVLPEGDGPFPGVVFLTGSGAQDRDESIFRHRPHAVLADALARAGVASLRVDDRGVGASTGDYATATMDALLTDARAVAGVLAARPEIRAVGALGHSQGGLTALRMAGELDFVVLMAAPVVRMDRVMAAQNERARIAEGMDSTSAAQIGRAIGTGVTTLAEHGGEPDSLLVPRLLATLTESLAALPPDVRAADGMADDAAVQARARAAVAFMLAPGLRTLFAYDPAPDLAALATPTLGLFGSKDFQVPADLNAPVLEAALAGIPGSETIVVANANHLFQTATTGAVAEYAELEQTMDPQTIAQVVGWIVDMTRLDD